MKRRQSNPREILVAATIDAMNRYVNQVLIPAKLIDGDSWQRADTGTGSDVCNKKYAIAADIADKWKKALEARTLGRSS